MGARNNGTRATCNRRRRRRLGAVRKFSTRKSVAAGRAAADESESVLPAPPVRARTHTFTYVYACMYASGGRSTVLGIDPAGVGTALYGRDGEQSETGMTAGGAGKRRRAEPGGTDRRCCALSVFTQLAGGRGGAAPRTRAVRAAAARTRRITCRNAPKTRRRIRGGVNDDDDDDNNTPTPGRIYLHGENLSLSLSLCNEMARDRNGFALLESWRKNRVSRTYVMNRERI